MGILNLKCDRCGKESKIFKMSFFNKQECCTNCLLIEQLHDDYKDAKLKEHEECLKGNYNFDGVGLPSNYNKWEKLFTDNFNFEIFVEIGYDGKQHENLYYMRDKDCKFHICLNNLKIQHYDCNVNKKALTDIYSLEELKTFIFSKNLEYNESAIKEFFLRNIERKNK